MKKKLYLFLLFAFINICSSLSLYAQRNFKSGYIITNTSDTVHGEIIMQNQRIHFNCSFREEPDDKVIKYKPGEIKAFRIEEDKYYVSKEVPFKNQMRLLFAEFLVKGQASVYYINDGAEHYYIETEKDGIVELTQETQYFENEKGQQFVKPSMHKNKLKAVMSDCPEISDDIERVNLNHSSLIKIAKDYHEYTCTTEQCIVYERESKPVQVKFGFFTGVSLNNISLGERFAINNCFGQVLVSESI